MDLLFAYGIPIARVFCQVHFTCFCDLYNHIDAIFIYNILSLSGGGRPFHPSVPSSIHPSSSSPKKKMEEEEEEEKLL